MLMDAQTYVMQFIIMDLHVNDIFFLIPRREEKYSGVQYAAARKIQALWRGFITRFKMKILHLAAQKIQV